MTVNITSYTHIYIYIYILVFYRELYNYWIIFTLSSIRSIRCMYLFINLITWKNKYILSHSTGSIIIPSNFYDISQHYILPTLPFGNLTRLSRSFSTITSTLLLICGKCFWGWGKGWILTLSPHFSSLSGIEEIWWE